MARQKNKSNGNRHAAGSMGSRFPEVIVDFEYEKGFLYMVIANVGSSSAKRISVKLDKKIRDFRGKSLSEMGILNKLEFMPPGKRIRLPIDKFQSYILRKQPMQVSVSITYFDMDGKPCRETIRHNLGIYEGLAELEPR